MAKIKVNTGRLSKRIQIQSQSNTQNNFGEPVSTWTAVYYCWADIDIQKSELVYATAEFIAKTTHRISWRFTSSVIFKPNMRIVYTEPATSVVHTYEIQAITNDHQDNILLVALAYELGGNE